MPDGPLILFPTDLQRQCMAEAERFDDLETGGTLMGYWQNRSTAVVTALIGAGPEAIHTRYGFEPDQGWQLEKIAQHYRVSGRRETYIGDWHSHPGAASGRLSRTDRRVLRSIIATPEARAPTPLMVVYYGSGSRWQADGWVGTVRKYGFVSRLSVVRARLSDPVH